MKSVKQFFGSISMKGALAIAVVAAGALTLAPWSTATSSAATNYAGMCGAGYSLKKSITYSGMAGKINVYTKGSGTATDWCLFTIRTGSAAGVRGLTMIEAWDHRYGSNSAKSDYVIDKGNFMYYAGPIKVYNTNMIQGSGQINKPNTYYSVLLFN